MTVINELLFVLHVLHMLRECEGYGNAGVGEGGGVVAVNAGCECMGGTRGKDIVLEMRVLRGVRGVGGVCEIWICLARGGVGHVG